jgi:UDP-N-acetylmuramate dehydrogenase
MTPRDVKAQLEGRFSGALEEDRPLAPLTTYRLGGPAALYAEPRDLDDVKLLAEALSSVDPRPPILVLGRGSNLLVSDHGWPGLVVRLGSRFSYVEPVGDPHAPEGLRAGAATPLPYVANWAARRGLAGLEFGVGVPGSVGGAVRMNAGAHGSDVAAAVTGAQVLDLGTASFSEKETACLGLSYRRSCLEPEELVLEASFLLRRERESVVRERMRCYREHRARTQPPAVYNAGSTFKNPPGDHAGRLVEAAGLKGFAVGGASVSTKHANFFVTAPRARAQDVHDLIMEVRARVREAFGVALEPEVRFAGDFGEGGGRR